jgi:hypothetical protein
MNRLRAIGAGLAPFVGSALVFGGMALHIVDPVIAAFLLAATVTCGEAIAYTILARAHAEHSTPYGFLAGANWLGAVVLFVALLEVLGVKIVPRVGEANWQSHGRQLERLENYITLVKRTKVAGDRRNLQDGETSASPTQ